MIIAQKQLLTRNNHLLQQRGILESARESGWQDAYKFFPDIGKQWGWKYPLVDPLTCEPIDYFWKNADNTQKGKKYRPFDGSLTDYWAGTWYIPEPQKVMEAVRDNEGVLYIANGAPSLLAYRAAGYYNSIAGRAETKPPEKLALVLTKYGVTRVLYPVDNDTAGKQSAEHWREALRGTGIDFEPLQWQTDNPKYDANDAWIESQFDKALFTKKVNNCLPLKLAPPKPRPTYDNADYSDNAPLIEKIISRLGIQHWNQSGYARKNVFSPFRDEKVPDFNINRDTGVGYDFGTGISYSPKQIADALGISYEKPQKTKKQDKPVEKHESLLDLILYDKPLENPALPIVETAESLRVKNKSWIKQQYLPTSWLRAVIALTDSRSSVVIVLMKLHHAFLNKDLDSSDFTIAQVLEAIGLPRGSTSAAIKTLENWGFVRDSNLYSMNITTKGNNSQQNSKGGRPARHYEIVDNPYVLALEFAERLDYYVVEYHTKNSFSPRLHTMASLQGMSLGDLEQWSKRNDILVSSATRRNIETDMTHWLECLTGIDRYDYFEYELEDITPLKLKTAIFENHLNKYSDGVQMSQHEICRLLGSKSTSNLAEILFSIGAISIPQQAWFEVDSPNKADITNMLIEASKPNNGRRGGVALAINFKTYGGKWLRNLAYVGTGAAHEKWEEARGTIDDLRIYVKLPNFYRFKTNQELDNEAEIFEESQTIEPPKPVEIDENIDSQIETDCEPVKAPEKPKNKKRRVAYSAKEGRNWDSHDSQWLFTQLQAEVFCWLNCELLENGIIRNMRGEVIKELDSNIEIIQFVASEITRLEILAPYHESSDFFGSDDLDFETINPPF